MIFGQSHNFALVRTLEVHHHHHQQQQPLLHRSNKKATQYMIHHKRHYFILSPLRYILNSEQGLIISASERHKKEWFQFYLITTSSPAVASLDKSHFVITGATVEKILIISTTTNAVTTRDGASDSD